MRLFFSSSYFSAAVENDAIDAQDLEIRFSGHSFDAGQGSQHTTSTLALFLWLDVCARAIR